MLHPNCCSSPSHLPPLSWVVHLLQCTLPWHSKKQCSCAAFHCWKVAISNCSQQELLPGIKVQQCSQMWPGSDFEECKICPLCGDEMVVWDEIPCCRICRPNEGSCWCRCRWGGVGWGSKRALGVGLVIWRYSTETDSSAYGVRDNRQPSIYPTLIPFLNSSHSQKFHSDSTVHLHTRIQWFNSFLL